AELLGGVCLEEVRATVHGVDRLPAAGLARIALGKGEVRRLEGQRGPLQGMSGERRLDHGIYRRRCPEAPRCQAHRCRAASTDHDKRSRLESHGAQRSSIKWPPFIPLTKPFSRSPLLAYPPPRWRMSPLPRTYSGMSPARLAISKAARCARCS